MQFFFPLIQLGLYVVSEILWEIILDYLPLGFGEVFFCLVGFFLFVFCFAFELKVDCLVCVFEKGFI